MLREAETATSNQTSRNEQAVQVERQSRASGMVAGFAGAMMRRERAKSEERNKSKPVPIPSIANVAQDDMELTGGDGSSDNSSRSPGKKQHRIRRRLLMGGLIKRKNRSLPDLRADDDDGVDDKHAPNEPEEDGPIEYLPPPQEDVTNANFEKSKLMRRSFHSSLGRNLLQQQQQQQQPAINKVPPPPPVRKTSHLTPLNALTPLPPFQSYDCYAESQITVRADIHHERTLSDLAVNQHDPLPPYPVVEHVRQPSDDFPPPPPPQELQLLSGDLETPKDEPDDVEPSGLLAALQRKRKEILGSNANSLPTSAVTAPIQTSVPAAIQSNQWLRELQNTLQNKKMAAAASNVPQQPTAVVQPEENGNVIKSVRKLASRFEQVRIAPVASTDVVDHAPHRVQQQPQQFQQQPQQQPQQQSTNQPIPKGPSAALPPAVPAGILDRKRRSGDGQSKKKSVTFCDQVILVSTAEDTEQDETYVPNPILQRVLRTAFQQEMVKDGQRQENSAPPPLVSPDFTNGTDEVDRPSLAMRSQAAAYQKLPPNSQVFHQPQTQHYIQQQQQQPHYQQPPPQQQYHQPPQRNGYGVPPSPMMGQRIGPPPNAGAPPSYAPPPQYHARGRFQPQTAINNNNIINNNNSTMKQNYTAQQPTLDQSRPPQMVQSWQHPPQQGPVQTGQSGNAAFAPCSLCGKKQVPSSYQYCSDCQFYMQRFQPKA